LREAVLKTEIPLYTVCSGVGEENLSFVRMLIDRGGNVNAKTRMVKRPCGEWKAIHAGDWKQLRSFGMRARGEGLAGVNLKYAVQLREKP
jgi:hypothetical protein